MNTTDPGLHRNRCSAKSLGQTRNSCAHKELQFHGVEDGFEVWVLDRTSYLHDATPQVKNPHIAQMSIKTFHKKGKSIAKAMDAK
jgi:hypothetical protein